MIQYLFLMEKDLLLVKWNQKKNIKLTIVQMRLEKLKNFFKFVVFNAVKI